MKRTLSLILCLMLMLSAMPTRIMAEAVSSVKASPDTVSEKSLVDGEYNFNHTWWYELAQNAHYDEHDFNAVKAFMEQKNSSGRINGNQLSADYRPNDPRTWGGTSWHKADDGTYYLASILFSSYLLRLNHKEKYTGVDLSLSGKLDLSECKYLMYVECHTPINDKNTYSDIDLTKCDKLYWVDLRCNYSDTLRLNGSTNINSVFIKDSGIKELDISDLTRLETFNCDNTSISGIDFSNCKSINRISITNCSLRNLYVKGLEKLEALNCSGNMLKSVDLSGHEKTLVELNISNNGIGGIADFSAFSALTRLTCDNCDLREINLPKRGAAISVSANGNMLTKIDVKSCADLAKLYVNSNYLTELDMSDCSNLKVLECANNMLTSLKLGDSLWFSGLVCNNNKLTKLELPDSANFLTTLHCDNNYIEELDISDYHYLSQFSCTNNKIKRLVMDGQFYTFDS